MNEADRDKPGVTDTLRDAGEKALAGIDTARKKASDALAATRDIAGDAISVTREKGEAVIEDTREKTFRAAAETNRLFQEHPIAAVAAAAAAGAVISIFMPRFALGARVGKLARDAARAAITTEAAQAVWSTVREATGKAPAAAAEDKDN